MELPTNNEIPEDLDFSRYIQITNEILVEIGAISPTPILQGELFN